jgi:choline-sulfatase
MPRRPNVVFIMSDQQRWDFTGWGANGVTFTPNVDEMGREGVVFRSAWCTSPLCSPSRAAIALGRYGQNSGCFTNLHEPPPGSPSFVSQFRATGYRTGCVGKTHMEIHAYDSNLTGPKHRALMDSLGWDDNDFEICGGMMICSGIRCAWSEWLRKVGRFDDLARFYTDHWVYFMDTSRKPPPPFSPVEFTLDEELKECSFVGSHAIEWLNRRDRSAPFFLHVGFCGPHSPVEPLPRFMDLYRDLPEPAPVGWPDAPDHVLDGRRGYRAMISEIDEWVGKIRRTVAGQGELDNTIFVYTSDHGEMAGDHRRFDKTCFYEASARVPMVFAGPGVKALPATDAMVELIDVGRTLCELCGVPAHALDQGRSLVPVLTGAAQTHRETVFCEMGCDRMLFDGRYKLMWGDPGSDTRKLGRLHLNKPANIPPSPPRLYDLAEDPTETRDLAGDPDLRDLLRAMLEKLIVRISENFQPQPFKSRGEYKPYRG